MARDTLEIFAVAKISTVSAAASDEVWASVYCAVAFRWQLGWG
jgi:hypothetical protein